MERAYLTLLNDILQNGTDKGDRTGTGTRSLFGYQMRHDLSKGFPLLTTKKVFWKAVVHELLWFIAGRVDVAYLKDKGIHIWDEWELPDGTIGPGYGFQWRNFGGEPFAYHGEDDPGETASEFRGVDQLRKVIERIKSKPDCRRLIVSAWNPAQIDEMALPPCHTMFQFYVADGKLSCQLYQRSADVFLGVPFNIASYALLTHLVAHECGLQVGTFIHTFGDVHIYNNHREQIAEQLQREPYPLPEVKIRSNKSIFEIGFDDIELIGYQAHPPIKAPVAV